MNETHEADAEAAPAVGAGTPTLPAAARRARRLADAVERNLAVRDARLAAPPGAGTPGGLGGTGNAGARPGTIVVIDDERDQLDSTVMLLKSSGRRAIGSTDGMQAVGMVTDEGAEVIVLDFMLAGMTGGDVCLALRADPRTRQVRIVMLSGTPEGVIRLSCTHYDVYLCKPPMGQALFDAIDCR